MTTTGFRALVLLTALGVGRATFAQTPAPFPRPGDPQKPAPPTPQTAAPNEQSLGVPVYPAAQFIASYDAGRGQRYYLYGSNASFTDVVNYYKNVLKQKGELVYDEPPVHEFDVGRYREETMAFPPGVTVKDYTWGGSEGYLNPKRGADPARFKTIVMIVPVSPGGTP